MGIAGMVKRPFTSTLNSSLAALLHLSDNVLVVETIFYSVFFPPTQFFFFFELLLWDTFESVADGGLYFSQATVFHIKSTEGPAFRIGAVSIQTRAYVKQVWNIHSNVTPLNSDK